MRKKRLVFEVDLGKVKDPAGVRHVMEALSELRSKNQRADLDPLADAIDRMPLLIPRDHPYAERLNALWSIWEELLTGRGLKLDSNGEPEIADLLTEMSDWFGELAAGKGVVQFGGHDEESEAD